MLRKSKSKLEDHDADQERLVSRDEIVEFGKLDLEITGFEVTSVFDGESYSHAVKNARLELDTFEDLPLLFDDVPSGEPEEHYGEISATLYARHHLGINFDIQIYQLSLGEIAERRSGFFRLGEFVPLYEPSGIALYDVDQKMVDAIRKAISAAKLYDGTPKIRIFFSKRSTESQGDEQVESEDRRYTVDKVLTWEHFGTIPY